MRKILIHLLLGGVLASCEKPTVENLAPPTLISFASTADTVGAVVTILGTNLSKNPANNTVTFTGRTPAISAPAFAVHGDTLRVRVPAGAVTGRLTLRVYGESVVSREPFTVLTGRWRRRAELPATRVEPVVFAVGGSVYVGTGAIPPSTTSKLLSPDCWGYNPGANTWTAQASFPGELRTGALSFTLGAITYVGFGKNERGENLRDLYAYNPATNGWTKQANHPPLSPIAALVAFSAQGRGYIVSTNGGQMWAYEPGQNIWHLKNGFPGTIRWGAVGFPIGSYGYVAGGIPSNASEMPDTFWEYNPNMDQWSRRASLPTPIVEPMVFALEDTGYLGYPVTGDVFAYDMQQDTWTHKTRFPSKAKVRVPAAVGVGGKAYVVGGMVKEAMFNVGREMSAEVWEFTP